MRIVLSAAYGMGNLGDEAIADVALQDIFAVFPDASVTVLAWEVERWDAAHPAWSGDARVTVLPAFLVLRQWRSPRTIFGVIRSLLAVARCDVLVWGGGGLIRNRMYWLRAYLRCVRFALLLRVRVVVLGVGVDEIDDSDVRRTLLVLRRAHALSVRDNHSASNLARALDIPRERVDVIGDGVFHLPSLLAAPVLPSVIGVNLCNLDASRVADAGFLDFLDRLSVALTMMCRTHGTGLLLLPSETRDAAFGSLLASRLPNDIVCSQRATSSPGEFLASVATCSFFVGMRMHAIILASRVERLPLFCFVYSAKVATLAEESGSPHFAPITIPAEDMAVRFERSFATPPTGTSFAALHTRSLLHRDWLRAHLAAPADGPQEIRG